MSGNWWTAAGLATGVLVVLMLGLLLELWFLGRWRDWW